MQVRTGILNAIFMYFILLAKPMAQSTGDQYFRYNVGINRFKGFVMPHNDRVVHLAYGRPTGFEIFLNRSTSGEQPWQQRYNRPDIGASFTYFDTDMVETGSIYSGMIYTEFHFFRSAFGSLVFRIGTGLSYTPNTYNREVNNLNIMHSSALAYNMQGRIGPRITVFEQWFFHPAITLSHVSNGAVKLPNSGINMVTADIGLGYQFKPSVLPETAAEAELNKQWHYNFAFAAGIKDLLPSGGKRYGFFILRAFMDKPLSRVNRLIFGLDFFNNRSLMHQLERDPETPNTLDHKRLGAVVGHELVVSRLSLNVEAGYYLYRPFKTDGDLNFYQRYGLKYHLTEQLFGTLMFKAHGGVADVVTLGTGIRFR